MNSVALKCLRVFRVALPVLLTLGFNDLALASFSYGNQRLAASAIDLLPNSCLPSLRSPSLVPS